MATNPRPPPLKGRVGVPSAVEDITLKAALLFLPLAWTSGKLIHPH